MAIMIKLTGFILSRLPYDVLEHIVEFLAMVFMLLPSKRKRILLANLHYAFPQWSGIKLKSVAKTSVSRMFEMGFFSLCYPFLSVDKLRRTVLFTKESESELNRLKLTKKPVLILVPHVCLFEALATSPFFIPKSPKKLGAIYRPNRNLLLDKFITSSRSNVGLRTFSRKEGFFKARKFLKSGNWLAVLFDQNAGKHGSLIDNFGRLCSLTNLPELMTKSASAIPVFALPKRLDFFVTKLELYELSKSRNVSLQANNLLKKIMTVDHDGLPEWLWSHARWKINFYPSEKFAIDGERKFLSNEIEKKLVFFIRMPNWLGDVVMSLPIVKAIIEERKDVRFILISKPSFVEYLKTLDFVNEVIEAKDVFSSDGMAFFWKLRTKYAECHLVLTNSFRGDLEALLIGSPHRFGLRNGNSRRFLLTDTFHIRGKVNSIRKRHQCLNWEEMAYFYGLKKKISYKPFVPTRANSSLKLGFIVGSSNNPKKCWSADNWANLCKSLVHYNRAFTFFLYGTKADASIASKIIDQLPEFIMVKNCAGETTISELAEEFRTCRAVIGCDSGGVHLANSLGVKVFVLFGPTNPKVTSPCFDSDYQIILPKGSPESGGLDINRLAPSEVFDVVTEYL